MRGRTIARRALRAVTTAAVVTAIVLGSAVGLNEWADGVTTHAAATHDPYDDAS